MPETIEAEVIEIDGKKPSDDPRNTEAQEEGFPRRFQQAVVRLDRRWWPLWVLLGIVFVALLLTVGLVFGVLYLVFALIRRFIATISSVFSGSGTGT